MTGQSYDNSVKKTKLKVYWRKLLVKSWQLFIINTPKFIVKNLCYICFLWQIQCRFCHLYTYHNKVALEQNEALIPRE